GIAKETLHRLSRGFWIGRVAPSRVRGKANRRLQKRLAGSFPFLEKRGGFDHERGFETVEHRPRLIRVHRPSVAEGEILSELFEGMLAVAVRGHEQRRFAHDQLVLGVSLRIAEQERLAAVILRKPENLERAQS